MGVRSPDAPSTPKPRRGKKVASREANCTVRIGRGPARTGVAALCPDELRFHTRRTGREGQDFFIHIRFDDITALAASAPLGTLTVSTEEHGAVTFQLGPLAVAWKKILDERPDLLRDLGVAPASRVALVAVEDEALVAALTARVRGFADGDGLDLLFAGAEHRADLARLQTLAQRVRRPGGVVWVVFPSGSRVIDEPEIAAAGRAAGLTDAGSVELSPSLRALRLTRF